MQNSVHKIRSRHTIHLRISHLLLLGRLHVELDRAADELDELRLVFFEIADNLRAMLDLAVHHLRVLLQCAARRHCAC